MKLKNSHILLIVMSLFLLISIGSVCASEVVMDTDAQLADDGLSEVVSADESDTANADSTTEKINTTVTSENARLNENEVAEVPVAVKDNSSQIIEINSGDLNVTEGNKIINFEYNNSIIKITDKLTVGNHSLVIAFLGNANYTNSSTNIILSIIGNKTLKEAPSQVTVNGTSVEIPIVISNGVDICDVEKDELTLNLTCTNTTGNKTSRLIEDFTVENSTIKFVLDNTKFVTANLAINYTAESKSSKNVAIKLASKINAENVTVRDTEDKNITVTVLDDEAALNITKADLKVVEGTKELAFTYANSTIKITDALAKGKHNIKITYKGNSTYAESTTNVTISVWGNLTIETSASVNVNSTKKVEVPINITNGINNTEFTKDDIKINVTYKDGNDTKALAIKGNDFEVVNGTIKFELENGDIQTANLEIIYQDDIHKNVTLNRIYNAQIIPKVTERDYASGNFTFLVVDIDADNAPLVNKSISVSGTSNGQTLIWITHNSDGSYNMGSSITLKTNGEGIATLENENFYPGYYFSTYIYPPAGEYNLTIAGSGDVKCNQKTTIKVNKIALKVEIVSYKEYFGSSKKLTINVTNSKTGEAMKGILVFFNITDSSNNEVKFTTSDGNKTNLAYTTDKGIVELPISNLAKGKYYVYTSVNGTSDYNGSTDKKDAEIVGIPLAYNVATTVYYNSKGLTIKVTDKRTGKVVPNAFIAVTFVGKKSLCIYLNGNKCIYTNGAKNALGIYLVSNNNVYTGYKNTIIYQTNSKGIITIGASLNVGKHKIKIEATDPIHAPSTVTKTITVKKASAKISAPKVTGYYKSGKALTIKVTNTKTKKTMYGAKVNVDIYVNKRTYFLKGTTLADGKLKMSLDQFKPGTYKVVITGINPKNFAAKKITSKFVVKKAPVKFTPKKLTAKKGKKAYFTVTVKNKKTKKVVSSGVKIKIKVYTGKKYKIKTVKTNSKGIAKLNIKSLKLKVGKHKVVVSAGTSYITAKSAKSTIKITKK